MTFITEDLETDLIANQETINKTKKELQKLFSDANYSEESSINGTTFTKELDDVRAAFYIDDKLNYNGYVTTKVSNFNVKGDISTVVFSANRLIDNFDYEI